MEKNLKRFKTLAVVLIVILISAVAFGGLYFNQQGVWKNVLPKFNFGMELDAIRELRFNLDTSEEEKEIYLDENGNYAGEVTNNENQSSQSEINLVDENGEPLNNDATGEATPEETASEENVENTENSVQENTIPDGYTTETRNIKVNPDENININNFEKTKKIIQKRLENIDLYEYNIRLDNITGELIVEVPDNENVVVEEGLITSKGKVELIDYQNGLVLLNNSNIKSATTTYTTEENGYQSYLIIQFDKDGTEKLKEISKNYVNTTNEDGTTSTKYVSLEVDDQTIIQTYFGDELTNGILQIPLGQPTESTDEFSEIYTSATRIASILNSEELPLVYKLNADNYIESTINDNVKIIGIISFAIIVLILSIVMVIKYKARGLKLAILNIGYIAILTIIFRYTNVLITVNSLVAFAGVVGINLLFECKLLSNLKQNDNIKAVFAETMKELYLAIIPVCIIAVIFTFMSGAIISSIGMVLFWGLAIQALYSGILYCIGVI